MRGVKVWESLRELVFPRACIGCDRDGFLLCAACVSGSASTIVSCGLEIRSCLPYAGLLRDAITEFKQGRRAFATDLAALLLPHVERGTRLVPLPTTRRRRAKRGFDQTLVLARLLKRDVGLEVAELLRHVGGEAQQGRSRSERLAATGRFAARGQGAACDVPVVLFDDVRTTGASLVDAARTLKDAGLHVTHALTLAWTPKEEL